MTVVDAEPLLAEANPSIATVIRHEQRVASARVVVKRFEERRSELLALHSALTDQSQQLDSPVSIPRTIAFAGYTESARELFEFYKAVFDADNSRPHRPSKEIEQELKLDLARYVHTWDPLADDDLNNTIKRETRALAREWRAARNIGELSVFARFAEQLKADTAQIATLVDQIEISLTDGPSRLHAPEARLADLQTELRKLEETLDDEQRHWQRLSDGVRLELEFMHDTQGIEGDLQAEALRARTDAHVSAISTLTGTLVGAEPAAVTQLGTQVGPGESPERRRAIELRQLDELIRQSESVAELGARWVAQLESEADYARLNTAHDDHVERVVIDNLTTDLRFGDVHVHDPAKGTALFVFAHPDDETTAGAEMIAEAHAQGMFVVMICATGGEAGRVQSRELDTPLGHRNFVDIRRDEQERAAELLGVDVLIRAGHIDAGMPNDPSHHHLRLANPGNDQQLTALIESTLHEFEPRQVFTHPVLDQQTAYGHHDHNQTFVSTETAVRNYVAGNIGRADFVTPQLLAVSVDPADQRGAIAINTSVESSARAIEARAAYLSQIPPEAPAVRKQAAMRTLRFLDATPAPHAQTVDRPPPAPVSEVQPALSTPSLGRSLSL